MCLPGPFMNACVCMCVCACTYIYNYMCVYACMYVCVWMDGWMNVWMYVWMYVCLYACMVGLLVGLSVGWLVGGCVCWLVGWLVRLLVCFNFWCVFRLRYIDWTRIALHDYIYGSKWTSKNDCWPKPHGSKHFARQECIELPTASCIGERPGMFAW